MFPAVTSPAKSSPTSQKPHVNRSVRELEELGREQPASCATLPGLARQLEEDLLERRPLAVSSCRTTPFAAAISPTRSGAAADSQPPVALDLDFDSGVGQQRPEPSQHQET